MHRVVRHVEVWSVAKIATAFAVCGYVIGMISSYLLWRAADRVGTIDGIEGFMEDSGGYDSFEIVGSVVFQSAAVGYAILCALFVAMSALGAVLFNLISDLTGGIRITAIDEDLIVTPARRPAPGASRRSTPLTAEPPISESPTAEPPIPERATSEHPVTDSPTADTPASEAPATEHPASGTPTASDHWKMPAPNETWTTPTTRDANGTTDSHERESESIGLGSADKVV